MSRYPTLKRAAYALLAGCALPIAGVMPAMAQEAPVEAKVATDEVGTDDIVVTARKRSESLSTAPLSISAVGGERLANQGVTNLEQLSASIPNVQIGRSPQTASINIRGIGSGSNRGFEQSVGMYIDGVYMARSRQYLQPMIDLERVEILRGPQGTLFGKNTVAGAINIITATAAAGEAFGFDVSGDYEPEFDTVRATASFSAPLTDTLGVRVAGRWETTDGYVNNVQRGTTEPAEKVKFIRGSINFEPSDTFSIIARASYTDRNIEGTNRVIRVFNPSLGTGLSLNSRIGAVAALLANPAFGASNGETIDRYTSYTGNLNDSPNDYDNQEIVNASLNAKLDLGWAELTSVTGYTELNYDIVQDIDFLPVNLVQNGENEDFSQISQELRLAFKDVGPVSGILGIYYEAQDLLATATTKIDGTLGGFAPRIVPVPTLFAAVIPGVGLTTLNAIGRASSFDQDSTTFAVFGEATINFSDKLRADLGLRWSRDKKDARRQAGLFGSDPNTLAVLPTGVATGALTAPQTGLLRSIMGSSFATFPHDQLLSRTEKHLTPSVNVQWDITQGAVAYASWSKGFKSGGFNFSPDSATPTGGIGPGTEFEDETVSAFELGVKGRFIDNRLRASLALFRADYEDLQVTSFRGTQFIVGNAAEVRSQGVEFETEFVASDNFKLGGALSYLDSGYKNFATAPCTIQQLATSGPTCVQDLSGRTTPFASKWSGSVHADLTVPVSDSLEGRFRIDTNWRSSMFLDGDLDPNVKQGGYAKINARVALGAEDGRWEVALFGRNLTNKATYTFSLDAPLSAGAFVAGIEEPRAIGIQLRFKN